MSIRQMTEIMILDNPIQCAHLQVGLRPVHTIVRLDDRNRALCRQCWRGLIRLGRENDLMRGPEV